MEMNQKDHYESILKRYSTLLGRMDILKQRSSPSALRVQCDYSMNPYLVDQEYQKALQELEVYHSTTSIGYKEQIEESEERIRDLTTELKERYGVSAGPEMVKEPYSFSLNKQQIDEVDEILNCGDERKVYSSLFGYTIYLRDLQTLRSRCWLNDNIINCVVGLAEEKAKTMNIKCHGFNSFFYKKLTEGGFKAVARWTRRVDLFNLDHVIIPINTSNTHWTMAVIHIKRKEIEYCDSMGGSGQWTLNVLREYLKNEYKDKMKATLDIEEWKVIDNGDRIPQQNNCSDCGVFTCVNCLLSCLEYPFDYGQEQIPMIRKYIAYCIVKGTLL